MAFVPPVHKDSSDTIYSLHGSVLKFDDLPSIQPYLTQLDQVKELEEVRFGGNTLGVDACKGVADTLASKKGLKVADFSDIFTGRLISEIPDSLRFLCTSLLYLPNLVSLDLSDNAFGGRSAEPMLEFIAGHAGLKTLKLNNNGMGPAGGAMIAGALLKNAENAKAAGRPAALEVVVCGRNRLENGSSQAFADAFAALGSLKEVRLPQNGIRPEGIATIVKGLQKNPHLETLDLQDNTFTQKGSRALAAALPSWPRLHTLNLSDCLLRPKGGRAVMHTLAGGSNPLLASVKLQSNELDSPALAVLALAIAQHLGALVDLELNGNYGEEEDEGYEKVRAALAKWGHGEALDELDELEEQDEEEEEEEDEVESEEEVVEEAEEAEEAEPKVEAPKEEDDDLAAALAGVKIE